MYFFPSCDRLFPRNHLCQNLQPLRHVREKTNVPRKVPVVRTHLTAQKMKSHLQNKSRSLVSPKYHCCYVGGSFLLVPLSQEKCVWGTGTSCCTQASRWRWWWCCEPEIQQLFSCVLLGLSLQFSSSVNQGMGHERNCDRLCLVCCISSIRVAFEYILLAGFLSARIWEVICQWFVFSVIAAI